jgi:hypothetical protein
MILQCLWGLLSTPYPLFQWYPQSKEIYSISAFNAQGLRVIIIVVVQIGAMKIYVAAVEAFRKNETQDETQFTTKIKLVF